MSSSLEYGVYLSVRIEVASSTNGIDASSTFTIGLVVVLTPLRKSESQLSFSGSLLGGKKCWSNCLTNLMYFMFVSYILKYGECFDVRMWRSL